MNKDMDNKKYYQNTFDEVHASEDLLGKVRNMKRETINGKIKSTRRAAYIAAAAALMAIVSSNVITYAATGSTWVEKVMVSINGEEKEIEFTKRVDAEGNEYLEGTFEVDENEKEMSIEFENEIGDEEGEDKKSDSVSTIAEIKAEGDKIYLIVGTQKIDITEDMKDEKCEGTYEEDGTVFYYTIEGNVEEYSISISN